MISDGQWDSVKRKTEKSNARSENFPGKLESRMKSIDKLDESVELGSAT